MPMMIDPSDVCKGFCWLKLVSIHNLNSLYVLHEVCMIVG